MELFPAGLVAVILCAWKRKWRFTATRSARSINVWEAGLDRYCKMEKGDFVGRAELQRAKDAGLTRTLVGLEMVERGIARDEYRVLNEKGEAIGVITSGSPSPTLCKNIALAYVPPSLSAIGTEVYVEIRNQKAKAQVVVTPFYKRAKKSAAPQTRDYGLDFFLRGRKEDMTYPASYRYTKQHEWIDVKDGIGTIGITDYAQHELGDVVFVELPKPGAKIEAGKSFGTVESVKAVSEIYAPVSGEW